MPRKTCRSLPPSPTTRTPLPASIWVGYILTAIVAAALGASITFFVVRHETSRVPAAPSAIVPTTTAVLTAPAALTDGIPPGQAASNLGNWYYDHQMWPEAIANYSKAIDNGVDNPDIHTDLGNSYRFAGQPQKALDHYQIAQKQNPSHENSLFNQGGVYADALHNGKQAIAIWQKYVKRFPQGQHVAAAHELIAAVQGNSGSITGKEKASSNRH